MIRIYYSDTALEASEKAAEVIAELVKSKPDCTLGLATGSSPIAMYDALAAKYRAGLPAQIRHTVYIRRQH